VVLDLLATFLATDFLQEKTKKEKTNSSAIRFIFLHTLNSLKDNEISTEFDNQFY